MRLDATRILEVVQSKHWKERILSWMDRILLVQTPLPSAPWLPWERATACLQFRMEAGVPLVVLHHRRSTSMVTLGPANMMVKVDPGPIRSILLPVNDWVVLKYQSCWSNKGLHLCLLVMCRVFQLLHTFLWVLIYIWLISLVPWSYDLLVIKCWGNECGLQSPIYKDAFGGLTMWPFSTAFEV